MVCVLARERGRTNRLVDIAVRSMLSRDWKRKIISTPDEVWLSKDTSLLEESGESVGKLLLALSTWGADLKNVELELVLGWNLQVEWNVFDLLWRIIILSLDRVEDTVKDLHRVVIDLSLLWVRVLEKIRVRTFVKSSNEDREFWASRETTLVRTLTLLVEGAEASTNVSHVRELTLVSESLRSNSDHSCYNKQRKNNK